MNFLRSAVLSAGALAMCACGGKEGKYALVTADSRPLPAVLQADSVCLVQLMNASIELKGRRFRSDYGLRKVCPTGSTALPSLGTVGEFKLHKSTLQFSDTLGHKLESAILTADSIFLNNGRHALKFVRAK